MKIFGGMDKKTPYILGLTGGLASGKSTVSGFFKDCGAVIIDADAIVHQLQTAGTPETKAIADRVGKEVLDANGDIDRRVLAHKAATDQDLLPFLESVLHPAVHREEKKLINQAAEAGHELVVLDVPLLFEAGSHKNCDSVALCHAPLDVRQKRALRRGGMTKEKWNTLLARRWPDEKAIKEADHIIHTDTPEPETRKEVEDLCRKLKQRDLEAYLAHWS